jgi:hypothetical protein
VNAETRTSPQKLALCGQTIQHLEGKSQRAVKHRQVCTHHRPVLPEAEISAQTSRTCCQTSVCLCRRWEHAIRGPGFSANIHAVLSNFRMFAFKTGRSRRKSKGLRKHVGHAVQHPNVYAEDRDMRSEVPASAQTLAPCAQTSECLHPQWDRCCRKLNILRKHFGRDVKPSNVCTEEENVSSEVPAST